MAKVWFCREGPDPTVGGPRAELTISESQQALDLSKAMYQSGLDNPPKFNVDSKMGQFTGPKFVVIEIEEEEALEHGWKPGFYITPHSPAEANRALANKENN